MTDTQEVQTKYGTVEVETVDCDSCGNTIGKDEAWHFGMDEKPQCQLQNAKRAGFACQHCIDSGPIEYPKVKFEFDIEGKDIVFAAGMVCITIVLTLPVII